MPDTVLDGDLNGFFRAGEPWLIGSSTFIAAGYGDQTEFIVVYAPGSNRRCLGIDPATTLRYEGGQLTIGAMFHNVETGEACGVTVRGDAALCAPGRILDPPARCELHDTEGTLNANGELTTPERTQIVRFTRCDAAPTSVEDLNTWALYNLHVFAGVFLDDPGAVGAAAVLGGEGSSLMFATLLTGLVQGTDPIGCIDEEPLGTVSLNGSMLTIDTTLAGRNNSENRGTAENCAVSFLGQSVYCAAMDPADFGRSGERTLVMRFEGTGRWTSDAEEGAFTAMYLGTVIGGGSGGIPPGVRVKPWADSTLLSR